MIVTYKVELKNDPACTMSNPLADAVGGCVRTSIARYNGECDMALIEAPDEASAQKLEKLMSADSNVLSFNVR